MTLTRTSKLIPIVLLLVACGGGTGATTRPASQAPVSQRPASQAPASQATSTQSPATQVPATQVPATDAPPSASAAPPSATAAADACTGDLPLKNPGRLTLSTDLPAFPPWVEGDASEQYPLEPEGGSAWSDADFSGEPYSGEGFESAMAYAAAEAMGFAAEEVDWIANPSFDLAFAPGEKPFDFHMAQISITPERAEAVTFSDPYFDSNQSLLVLAENEIASAASIADLKGYALGAQQSTTSYDLITEVIQPDVEPRVYPDNSTALAALSAGGEDGLDGLIVDLATAFYMRDGLLGGDPEGMIVGQFGPPAEPDHVGFVMELDNPLVSCVNQAIAEIKADGTHQSIVEEWINSGQDVPFLE